MKMHSLSKIITSIALFLYPLLTTAHSRRPFNDVRSIDAPNAKLNTNGAEFEPTIHDAHLSKSYSRHVKDITNEFELYTTKFSARVIIQSTISPDEYPTLKNAITSTLDQNLNTGFKEFYSFSITSFTFTSDSQRRMERTGRYLANTASAGRTVIDVEGEAKLFGVAYDRVTGSELNEKVFNTLEDNLDKVSPFDSLTFKVTEVTSSSPSSAPSINMSLSPSSTPSVSPSVNDSVEPSTKPSAEPSVEFSSEPTVMPSIEPSAEVVDILLAIGEEAVRSEEIGGGGPPDGLIIAGVLSVVAVTMGIGLFAKKRYSLSTNSFRRNNGRRGYVREGELDTSIEPKIKKRDAFFDQYIVECCTDNDLIFDNNDEHYFRPQSSAPDNLEFSNDSFDVDTSADTYDKLIP